MISLALIKSFIEFFADIPYNMRAFRFPVLVMMAEHEELVDNATSERLLDMAQSTIKDKVLYRGAYHELQKEVHIKEQLIAKVIAFTQRVAERNGRKPFGVLPEKIRHG